ncbi:hypothetical protein BDF20DRAFT_846201 [Mycotypha africana]|uniref:uncharacterized protein n=1 Tax=Mycotypha africana TaxID=64632 RepID=UPI0022FFE596|nr:uncharacterized protein BDF20DRAFT_846201 [Mycotypha africana]KAI8991746.1 hypothetical protein BDF20DRAFT_846201 [Mycotypha africana]
MRFLIHLSFQVSIALSLNLYRSSSDTSELDILRVGHSEESSQTHTVRVWATIFLVNNTFILAPSPSVEFGTRTIESHITHTWSDVSLVLLPRVSQAHYRRQQPLQ